MSLVTLFICATLSLLPPTDNTTSTGSKSDESSIVQGTTMMKDVFNRFHINYEMSRTHKIGYYKEVMLDSQDVYYYAESIVDIYIPSNLNQVENAAIQPIRTRKKVYHEVGSENLLFGNASDMARSSIWRPNSFLNEKNRENYRFQYVGESSINNFQVSIIEFEPSNFKGKVSGKIFVDKKSLAIIRIEYTPDATKTEIWNSVSWTEEFSYKNGAFELTKVQFNGISSGDNHQYTATLVMDQLEVVTRIPENDSFIREEVSLFNQEDTSTANFWRGYYKLKKTLDADQTVPVASN